MRPGPTEVARHRREPDQPRAASARRTAV